MGSKTAEKNSAQTNRQTDKQTNQQTLRNNGHLAVNQLGREPKPQGKNIMSASATQGGHNNSSITGKHN